MEITKAPDANGVYEATVKINGIEKGNISTFFPKHWMPEDVINAIEEVYTNPSVIDNTRNMLKGTINDVPITIFLDDKEKIFQLFSY